MNELSSNRNCPVCDSVSKEFIIKIDFELFDGHPMNGGYDLVACKNCGFIYADTPVSQSELDRYYTDLSKYEDKILATGGGFTENDKNRLADTALLISRHISDKNLKIVDLGCSNGGLLKELMLLGYKNVTGIDPSAACVAITKDEVGCECYQYSLYNIPESIGKFDVVISTHVLEHLLDVRSAINIFSKLLNPGGYVYIECPNAANYKEVIHAPLQEFNAEHINHFTETAFQNLMEDFGFEKITTGDKVFKIASDQDYHAVYGIFRMASASSRSMNFDTTIKGDIQQYIDKSNAIFDQIKKHIATLPEEIPIALYGLGQFSFKLLKTAPFQKGRQTLLFDNNTMNVGKKINGAKILPGKDLLTEYKKGKFSIVISSLIHEAAIRKNIEDLFKKENEAAPVIIGFSALL